MQGESSQITGTHYPQQQDIALEQNPSYLNPIVLEKLSINSSFQIGHFLVSSLLMSLKKPTKVHLSAEVKV
jgi:hypothetical protein